MPPTDYAVMPGTEDVTYTKRELDAELVLAPIAGKLMMFSRAIMPVMELALLAGYVYTGVWARGHLVPHGWDVAEACFLLLLVAVTRAALLQSPGKEEPEWARAALVHEESLHGQVPAPVFQQLKAVMARMTAGTRWHSAHLYVARCTDVDPVHYGACCAGGTYPRNGRLLVILGEHLLQGQPEIALATLAHEQRHVTQRRLYLYAVAAVTGTLGLVVVGWAVPWPALLPVAAAVRIGAVLLLWAIEFSCDLGAAGDVGKDAIAEAVSYKQRTKGGSRALWPAWQRVVVGILTWVAGPEHPPYAMRRWAIRTLAR
jgi:hypothetical protein